MRSLWFPRALACLDPLMKVGHADTAKGKRILKDKREAGRDLLTGYGLAEESVEELYPFELSGGMSRKSADFHGADRRAEAGDCR